MASRKKKELPNRVYSGLVSTVRLGDTTVICPICGRQIHLGKINVEVHMDIVDGHGADQQHYLVGRTIQPSAILRDTSLMYRQGFPNAYDYLGQHLIDISCRDDGRGSSHQIVPMIGVPSILAPMIDQLHAHKIWVMGTDLIENDAMFARMDFISIITGDTTARIADIMDESGSAIFGRASWSDPHSITILNSDLINYMQNYYQIRIALSDATERLIDVLSADATFMESNNAHDTWFDALIHRLYAVTPNVVTEHMGFYPTYTTDPEVIRSL